MSRLIHFTYSGASRCSPNQAQQRFWLQRVRGQCFHISDVNELSDAQHHSSQHVNTFNYTLLAFWNSGAINSYPKSITIPFIMNKVFINKHLSPYFPYFEGEFQQYDWTNTKKKRKINTNINHTRKSLRMAFLSWVLLSNDTLTQWRCISSRFFQYFTPALKVPTDLYNSGRR